MTVADHRIRPAAAGVALTLATLALSAPPAVAQLPPIIPVQHFFNPPEIAVAQISPDGRWLAYLKEFFGTYLGGRVQKEPPPGAAERLKVMTVNVDTLKAAPPDTTAPRAAT
jgi:hypothetical protein